MKLSVQWREREQPLMATAVFIPNNKIGIGARRLLSYSDEQLAMLEGLIANSGMLILGELAQLPWVDGCCYLGSENQTPHLLMSVLHQPTVPSGLLDKAIYRVYEQPMAIVPGRPILIPTAFARQLSRQKLQELQN